MKKKKKGIIDIYETMYDVDIVVANRDVDLATLAKQYTYVDGVVLDHDTYIVDSMATSAVVKRISDNKTCILIKDNKDSEVKTIDKKIDRINTIAHESMHAVLYIYDIIDQKLCSCSSEPICYLAGYIAGCVYKTLMK